MYVFMYMCIVHMHVHMYNQLTIKLKLDFLYPFEVHKFVDFMSVKKQTILGHQDRPDLLARCQNGDQVLLKRFWLINNKFQLAVMGFNLLKTFLLSLPVLETLNTTA